MAAFDDDQVETELLLLTLSECFVYRIPALQGSAGHRAFDWNLEKPALTGQLKVFSAGEEVTYVRIYHKNADGESKMFAECPVRLDRTDKARPQAKLEFFFESVTDSSRYFVVRVEDRKTKKHIYLGIGFSQRQDAFDLRAALDDQMRRVSRMHGDSGQDDGVDDSNDATAAKDSGLNRKLDDMTLKEGQKIKINLNLGGGSRARPSQEADGSGGVIGAVPLLSAPSLMVPPSPATKKVASAADVMGPLSPMMTSSAPAPVGAAIPAPIIPVATGTVDNSDDDEDDDFGDFQ